MFYFGEGKGETKSAFIHFERVSLKSKIKDFFFYSLNITLLKTKFQEGTSHIIYKVYMYTERREKMESRNDN